MKPSAVLKLWIAQVVFILISHTCEMPESSLTCDRFHHVYPRATGEILKKRIDQMKMLGKVMNAVLLTQSLIIGSIPADGLFSEFLKMGNVTVSQVSGLDIQKITDAANSMKELPSKLKNDANVKKVEVAYQKQIEIGKDLENITNFGAWPGQNDFTTKMNDIKNKGLDTPKRENMKKLIRHFGTSMDELESAVGDTAIKEKIVKIKTKIVELLSAIEALPTTPNDPDFNSMKITGFEEMTILFEVYGKYKSLDFKNLDETSFNQNVDNLHTTAEAVKSALPGLRIIANLLENRMKNPKLNSLTYTIGFQAGFEELNFLSGYLNNPWMSDVIHSNSLETALRVLQQLYRPLKDANSKIDKDGISVITSVIDKLLPLSVVNSSPSVVQASVTALKTCGASGKEVSADGDKAEPAFTNFTVLEKTLAEKKKVIIAAGTELKASGIKAHLEQLKTMCEQAEGKTSDLAADSASIFSYYETKNLLKTLENYNTATKTQDDLIQPKANLVSAEIGKIKPNLLESLDRVKEVLNCFKRDFKVIPDAISNIQTFQITANLPDFDGALTIAGNIKSSSSDYDSFKTAVEGMRGRKTKETDGLNLLKEPPKTKNLLIGVQLMIRMNDIVQGRLVENNMDTTVISTEMANVQLDPQDQANLNNLISLSPKFQTLKADLNVWRDNIKDTISTKLSDYNDLFIQTAGVPGISEDLSPMSKSLQVLSEKVQDQNQKNQLDSVKTTLDSLDSIGLDFASYSGSFASASSTLGVLDTFFQKFSESMKDSPRPPNDSSPNDSSNDSSFKEGGAASGSNADGTEKGWTAMQFLGYVGTPLLFIAIVIGVIIFVCLKCNKKKPPPSQSVPIDKTVANQKKRIDELEDEVKKEKELRKKDLEKIAKLEEQLKKATEENQKLLAAAEATVKDYKKRTDNAVAERKDAKATPKVLKEIDIPTIRNFLSQFNGMLQMNRDKGKNEDLAKGQWVSLRKIISAGILQDTTHNIDLVMDFREECRYGTKLIENTRVIVREGGFENDFYHGNRVDLLQGGPIFAMEGPQVDEIENGELAKKDNIQKFWYVAKQEKVEDIVMLTTLEEFDSGKCARYFPMEQGAETQYGQIKVKCLSTEDFFLNEIVKRKLCITYPDGTSIEVNHYHYLVWPDFGVPNSTDSLVKLLKELEKTLKPTIVHCAAGIGRTGVLAFVERSRQLLADTGDLNVLASLLSLRQFRAQAVQKTIQLEFAVVLLIDLISLGFSDKKLKDRLDKIRNNHNKNKKRSEEELLDDDMLENQIIVTKAKLEANPEKPAQAAKPANPETPEKPVKKAKNGKQGKGSKDAKNNNKPKKTGGLLPGLTPMVDHPPPQPSVPNNGGFFSSGNPTPSTSNENQQPPPTPNADQPLPPTPQNDNTADVMRTAEDVIPTPDNRNQGGADRGIKKWFARFFGGRRQSNEDVEKGFNCSEVN